MGALTKLFEPITIGPMEIKNRIVMTGIAFCSTEDTTKVGVMHQKYIDFFEERAKGGAGLIILPDTTVDKNLRFQCHPCIANDEYNPGLSALTEAVHMWGAKIAPDLWHNGYRIEKEWQPHAGRPISSSPIPFHGQVAKEMNAEDIEEVQQQFVDASVRAKATGFDAIHLAGHFGFLIAQFMSPRFNTRTDRYGGSLENRMRFPMEIIDKIKGRIGDSLPIIFRLSADEFVEGGLTINDTKVIAKMLQDAGVDILNVVAGLDLPDKYHMNVFPMGFQQGPFVDLGAEIKQAVDIPVIIVGRITDPLFAEQVLEEGKADMIGMTRQLYADPETPLKASDGRFSDIAPCIGCNVCMQSLLSRTVSRCSVNGSIGREKEFVIVPAEKPLSVMVIGGGPAGIEAACVASSRGHRVILYEKETSLGGQFILSMQPPHKGEIKQYLEYLVNRINTSSVECKLGIEVTPEIVDDTAPDIVIIATGSLPLVPDIPGIDGPNVVTAWDVLAGQEVGDRVVIAGGGLVGCETAEYLREKGKKITIVEILPEIACDVEKTNRSAMMERFAGYDFTIHVNATAEVATERGLGIVQENEQKLVEADTIVIALGARCNDMLARQLRHRVKELHVIGDSFKPGRIVHAVNHAAYIARQI